MNNVSKMWTKKQTQETIKALREAGYNIVKDNDIYKSTTIDTDTRRPIFTAMVGSSGYLVSYRPDLFEG